MAQIYNINIIKKLLPHRYPMLLIDALVSVGTEKISAIKNVSFNEPFFQGHFPEDPVMPGVLIIEALAQAAGAGTMILHNMHTEHNNESKTTYFSAINNAKFRRKVTPGDVLALDAYIKAEKAGFFKFNCEARVGNEVAAQAEIMLYLKHNPEN